MLQPRLTFETDEIVQAESRIGPLEKDITSFRANFIENVKQYANYMDAKGYEARSKVIATAKKNEAAKQRTRRANNLESDQQLRYYSRPASIQPKSATNSFFLPLRVRV